MFRFCLIVSFLVLAFQGNSQVTQFIITATERTDRTFHKNDSLLLELSMVKNQVVFTLDTVTNKLITKTYITETQRSIRNTHSTIKSQAKRKIRKWKHELNPSEWNRLSGALHTDMDSLQKDLTVLHTSHHYLHIELVLISGSDSSFYSKTKPFGYLTPWQTSSGMILNPALDEMLAKHLPHDFIGRNELLDASIPKGK